MTRSILAVLALAGMPFAHAFAHAHPQTEAPAAKSTVATAPAEVAIEFDDELEGTFSSIVVQDAHGTRVDDGHSHTSAQDPRRLTVGLKPLAAGTYKVIWKATDTDTHTTTGSYVFTVRP